MIIKRFFIPSDEATPVGLQEVDMPRLGRFIALAGKNGAGKTRLLNKLNEYVNARTNNLSSVYTRRNNLINLERAIRDNPGHEATSGWQQSIDAEQLQLTLTLGRVISDENAQFKVLRFVPKNLVLEDPRQNNQQVLISRFSQASNAEIEGYASCCQPYVQQLQNRWWSATHQSFSGPADERKLAINEYEKLNELVLALLGVSLTRTINDEASIFDKPLADSGLSGGQKIVLQLAAALHAQRGTLDNTVFILDELENHLHPSVAIDILERLNIAAPNAQIWVATHSIPLLAYVLSIEPMALWYMENGKVTHAGRHPERVLKSLLGDETRIGQLHAFTGLPAQLATINYAVESLLPPNTLSAEEGDPQANQIARVLEKMTFGRALSVLDYGAGKGRLLEGLAAASQEAKLAERIDYLAFDDSPKDKAACLAVIMEHFDEPDTRYFNSPEHFFAAKDDGSVDVVIMCNVFHEIPPSQWLPILSQTSLILRALKTDGFLLLVEDLRIPVGEKAHEHGFLALDTAQLKTLFSITEADIRLELFAHDDYRNDGRLKAHLIAKSLLAQIGTETRTQAISQLLDSSLNQVRQLRQKEASYANGQVHGFWTQQLANAYMYLKENS